MQTVFHKLTGFQLHSDGEVTPAFSGPLFYVRWMVRLQDTEINQRRSCEQKRGPPDPDWK